MSYGDLPPLQELTGMDALFAKNRIFLLVFGFCCNGIALILGIVGLVVCKDPRARENALTVTIIGSILTVIGIGFLVIDALSRK